MPTYNFNSEATVSALERMVADFYSCGRDLAALAVKSVMDGKCSAGRSAVFLYTQAFRLYAMSGRINQIAGRLDDEFCGGEMLLYGERVPEDE